MNSKQTSHGGRHTQHHQYKRLGETSTQSDRDLKGAGEAILWRQSGFLGLGCRVTLALISCRLPTCTRGTGASLTSLVYLWLPLLRLPASCTKIQHLFGTLSTNSCQLTEKQISKPSQTETGRMQLHGLLLALEAVGSEPSPVACVPPSTPFSLPSQTSSANAATLMIATTTLAINAGV